MVVAAVVGTIFSCRSTLGILIDTTMGNCHRIKIKMRRKKKHEENVVAEVPLFPNWVISSDYCQSCVCCAQRSAYMCVCCSCLHATSKQAVNVSAIVCLHHCCDRNQLLSSEPMHTTQHDKNPDEKRLSPVQESK